MPSLNKFFLLLFLTVLFTLPGRSQAAVSRALHPRRDRTRSTATGHRLRNLSRNPRTVSSEALRGELPRRVHATNATASPSPTPSVPVKVDGRGYSFAHCERDDDCVGERTCMRPLLPDGKLVEPCNLSSRCFCYLGYEEKCDTCERCVDFPNETCRLNKADGSRYCYSIVAFEPNSTEFKEVGCVTKPSPTPSTSATPSRSATPSPSPESAGVCIDAGLFDKQPALQRVFDADRWATVLCDQAMSCATPGHMVTYRNVPMSMSMYCKRHGVSCTRDVMLVNSPRFAHALRVATRTKDLHFTALAARHETRAEVLFLSVAIYVGI